MVEPMVLPATSPVADTSSQRVEAAGLGGRARRAVSVRATALSLHQPSTRRVGLDRLIYSASNYRFMLVADLACAAILLGAGLWWFNGSPGAATAIVAMGFAGWGGVEYGIHRWVLHGPPSIAARAHARHHAEPKALISMPAFVSPALAGAVCLALSVPLGRGAASLAVCGLYAGYNYYALLHHLLHRHPSLRRRLQSLARLEAAHGIHHGRSAVNYGVSTTWCDRLMGTYQPVARRPHKVLLRD